MRLSIFIWTWSAVATVALSAVLPRGYALQDPSTPAIAAPDVLDGNHGGSSEGGNHGGSHEGSNQGGSHEGSNQGGSHEGSNQGGSPEVSKQGGSHGDTNHGDSHGGTNTKEPNGGAEAPRLGNDAAHPTRSETNEHTIARNNFMLGGGVGGGTVAIGSWMTYKAIKDQMKQAASRQARDELEAAKKKAKLEAKRAAEEIANRKAYNDGFKQGQKSVQTLQAAAKVPVDDDLLKMLRCCDTYMCSLPTLDPGDDIWFSVWRVCGRKVFEDKFKEDHKYYQFNPAYKSVDRPTKKTECKVSLRTVAALQKDAEKLFSTPRGAPRTKKTATTAKALPGSLRGKAAELGDKVKEKAKEILDRGSQWFSSSTDRVSKAYVTATGSSSSSSPPAFGGMAPAMRGPQMLIN